MEAVIERIVNLRKHGGIRSRALHERNARVVRQILPLRAEQIVDHQHLGCAERKQPLDEVGADKARAARNEYARALHILAAVHALCSKSRRCVYVCVMPYSL